VVTTPSPERREMFSIRFPASLLRLLRRSSAEAGMNVSTFVREAVVEKINATPVASVAIPPLQSRLEQWFTTLDLRHIPYGGVTRRCRACGLTTRGPTDPRFTGHSSTCPVYAEIRALS
jgi:hypothetical protein